MQMYEGQGRWDIGDVGSGELNQFDLVKVNGSQISE
jgi:hypothetical protein